MSTQDIRKLSSVLRSIELIEEKINTIHQQYTSTIDRSQALTIDDSNVHLQIFFQHLEQLLQLDLKNRKSLLSNTNKSNYWNFFVLALKESKGLYDSILYVINSQEVKTSTGRGRLFLRFCLQHHRLGDVIQQSFMMNKIVNQFYNEECFWTSPVYMNRLVQALYQLNDVQFDLLANSQYQLDVCWPTGDSTEIRTKIFADAASRYRNNSISSYLSMDSVASPSIISSSIPINPSFFQNLESSLNDGSSAQSLSSIDEFPENTMAYWKERCHQLELQLQQIQPNSHDHSLVDAEVQCLSDEIERVSIAVQTIDDDEKILNALRIENEQNKSRVTQLQDEITDLNFQLSSIHIQRSSTTDKMKDHEREIAKYQTLCESKDIILHDLQQKYDEQTNHLQSIENQHQVHSNEQNRRMETLTNELEQAKKCLETERISNEKERNEFIVRQDQLEAGLHEKILDFEEMKRRLVKAVRDKAELFDSLHSYEAKLTEAQSRKWIADEEILNCTKCGTTFGWTVRKYRCRRCQNIFCYYCSNNLKQGSTPNTPQYRLCDYCNDQLLKESLMPDDALHNGSLNDNETDNVDVRFEVRAERLATP